MAAGCQEIKAEVAIPLEDKAQIRQILLVRIVTGRAIFKGREVGM